MRRLFPEVPAATLPPAPIAETPFIPAATTSTMTASTSTQSIRRRLSREGFTGGTILLDGKQIGRFITYGKESISSSSQRRSSWRKTMYGSRIYQGKARVEVEATTPNALLNKIAGAIAQAMKSGDWAQA